MYLVKGDGKEECQRIDEGFSLSPESSQFLEGTPDLIDREVVITL